MTFGLCNTPATFQFFMNNIFSDLIDQGHLVIYLDDILLFHTSLNKLHNLTHSVLQCLQKYDLYLKPEKCTWDQTSVKYLGVIISEGQVRMDPAKLSGIIKWPQPRSLKETRSFLGFCNFYQRFIQNYSKLAHSLHLLTKKDTPFTWAASQEFTFRSLIHTFTITPVLALPDSTLPFCLITNASDFAMGAILE
jgi:hypothetical protein